MSPTALKNAVLSEKIDWLAYTHAVSIDWEFPACIDAHWKDIRALPHYTNGQENKQGIRRYWNIDNPKQGRYVVMDGVASGFLQDDQFTVLEWVNTPDRKATRIDFALDITHSKFHPRQVRRRFRRGEGITHAQSTLTFEEDESGGYTYYVGRKTSETYTRIYDKAIEQKTNFAWVRCETVYQGERARPALASYCECKSTRPLIKSHIDFPKWDDWLQIMSGDVVKLAIKPRETRTRAWLLSSVAKTLAREIAMDEDHSFWFDMMGAIKGEIAKLDKGGYDIDF